jgi:glutathione synthase/RimK-type ligase-like ATP-grasp enzyme
MMAGALLGIYREQVFSPGKIQDDAAVLDATLDELSALGWKGEAVHAEELAPSMARPSYVLSMAQSDRILDLLEEWSMLGTRIVNSVSSIRNCYRKPLTHLLLDASIRIPPSRIVPLEDAARAASSLLTGQLWLKRGDVHAIQAGDVVPVNSREDLSRALDHFRSNHVRDVLIQEHVEGPVVKFYGVGGQEFFKAYLAETGEDVTSQVEHLRDIARNAARVVGLEVYGGDGVLTRRNEAVLIDLNDWPSFSRCFRSAARSIAAYMRENGLF